MSRYFYATTQDNQMLRVRSTAIRERICWAHDATPITGHDARAMIITSSWEPRVSDKTGDPYDVISFGGRKTKHTRRRLTPSSQTATAYRYWSKAIPRFHVESVKGERGDWGYTTDSSRAIPLTHAQQMRFAADCRAAGVTAFFLPVKEPDGESTTTTRK